MAGRRTQAGLVAAGAVAAGGAWLAQRRIDERRVRADPENGFLTNPPQGEPIEVRSGDGTRLHAEAFGPEDAPAVVLAHGWTCALRFWAYQIRDLSTDHRVIAYDQRGHARSEAPAGGDWSVDALGADLQAVLETCLPDGRRAVLAGHSMGGMTIVGWAGRFPEEVERRAAGAMLCNTGMGDLVTGSLVLRTPPGLDRVKQVVGRALLSLDGPLPSGPTPLVYRAIRYVAHGPIATPAQVAFSERMTIETPRSARAGCGAELSRLDIYRAVEKLTVPTAVIAGERDRLTPPPLAERFAAALPDLVELVEVPQSGHMTPIETPEEVNRRIRALAARTSAAPSSAEA